MTRYRVPRPSFEKSEHRVDDAPRHSQCRGKRQRSRRPRSVLFWPKTRDSRNIVDSPGHAESTVVVPVESDGLSLAPFN